MTSSTDPDQETPAGERNGSHPEPPLADELLRATELLRTRAALWLQGVQLAARRTAWLVGITLWAGFALAVATVTAMVLLFRGLAAGMATLTGSEWAGDFGAGALFFGGVAAVLALIAAQRRRRLLRRLQERFGEPAGMSLAEPGPRQP